MRLSGLLALFGHFGNIALGGSTGAEECVVTLKDVRASMDVITFFQECSELIVELTGRTSTIASARNTVEWENGS